MEWERLDRLRDLFLRGDKSADYWRDERDLAAYDEVFAQRIGWKWDYVLAELRARGYAPAGKRLVDWACGSGIASRSVLVEFPEAFSEVEAWDRSPIARRFASAKLAARGGGRRVLEAAQDPLYGFETKAADSTVVLSHVLNEMNDVDRARLASALGRCAEVIWVEPGTFAESRRLGEMRAKLLVTHRVIGPCFHEAKCGALRDENERDWCHTFAQVPTEAFTSPEWAEASKRLGFDLRSLPLSYLAMRRKDLPAPAALPTALERHWMVGRPRTSKGFLRLLTCSESGELRERRLQKKSDSSLFKRLEKERYEHGVLFLKTDADEILGGGMD